MIKINDDDKAIFKNHTITVVEEWNPKTGHGEYIFKRPDSGMYSIHILFRPNTIIIYGDTQPNIILRQSGIDLPWLLGSVNDPNYLLSKSAIGDLRKYDQEATEKYAVEIFKEHNIPAEKINNMMECLDWSNPTEAYECISSVDYDANICETYQHCAILVTGLIQFCELIKNSQPKCELKLCKSKQPATVYVNENIGDVCFRVGICKSCAEILGMKPGNYLPPAWRVEEIFKLHNSKLKGGNPP